MSGLSQTEAMHTPQLSRETGHPEEQAVVRVPANPDSNRLTILLALLAVYLIWGSTYLVIRVALRGFPPFLMAGIRFLFAGALLYAFLRRRGAPTPTRPQWGAATRIGVLMMVGNAGVVFAEQWVSSGLAALAVAAVPLWSALFVGLWGRWPSRREGFGLAIGFVGILLLNLEGNLRTNPVGAVALLLATVSWAFGSVWGRRLNLPQGLMASAAEMLTGGGVLLGISLLRGERLTAWPTMSSLWALAYLILGGSVVAFSAYTYLLARVRPTLATSYAYANPVVAVGLGAALAGEHITHLGLAAMFVILAGVALVALSREKESR